ncbi:MAG TPA: prepilin peptidase [Candidatus Babeliales bacterium]|nr:prepilin peptidase [Candidatus Babeliales bacterium]
MILYFLTPFFLCWGSFLNVLAYRLIKNQSIITPRSSCPHCHKIIAWYDNIPVISWVLLNGRCRVCHQPISFFYPFIEMLTAILLSFLYIFIPHHYFFAYFIFFSALIVTIRSDAETMLISRFTTLFLVPFGCIFSAYGLLPLSLTESILGAFFGYSFLYIINSIFKYLRNINGIGEGDLDLILFIGSFTGVAGCWMSITIGSILGSLYGLMYLTFLYFSKDNNDSLYDTKIPFGPFLACGALIFIFLQKHIFYYILL